MRASSHCAACGGVAECVSVLKCPLVLVSVWGCLVDVKIQLREINITTACHTVLGLPAFLSSPTVARVISMLGITRRHGSAARLSTIFSHQKRLQ